VRRKRLAWEGYCLILLLLVERERGCLDVIVASNGGWREERPSTVWWCLVLVDL
jgi:hypothetical protein